MKDKLYSYLSFEIFQYGENTVPLWRFTRLARSRGYAHKQLRFSS